MYDLYMYCICCIHSICIVYLYVYFLSELFLRNFLHRFKKKDIIALISFLLALDPSSKPISVSILLPLIIRKARPNVGF